MSACLIPERSAKANSAKSVLFESLNDIDIYIEDTGRGAKKLAKKLFSRVFGGRYKISEIFPLGGREAVLEEHRKHSRSRPSLYVIDGDLHLLSNQDVESSKGLYRLPFYCIENLLCDPVSFIRLMDDEDVERDLDELACVFDYESWLEQNSDLLHSLFLEYSVSKVVNPDNQTVGYKVNRLALSNRGELDESKVLARIGEIKQASIEATGSENYNATMDQVIQRFEQLRLTKLDIVSGKDYLFKLLKTRMKSLVDTRVNDCCLKYRLAKECDISAISDIHDFIYFNKPE